MNSIEYLNAYLSSIRSGFLNDSFLQEISKAESISTIYEMLKKTHYRDYMDYRDSIKLTIEKALFKRFNDVINRIRKHISLDKLIYMIAEYESKNILIMLDEKYRKIEHPKIVSFLDNKEYLIKEYRRINNVIGFLKITTFGRYVKIDQVKDFTNISESIDRFVIEAKYKIAGMFEELRDVVKIELANRLYLIEKYIGKRIMNYSESLVLREIKIEEDLFIAEQKLNEIIYEKYKKVYPRTWMSMSKAYIILKLLDRERRYINRVINREDWSIRR